MQIPRLPMRGMMPGGFGGGLRETPEDIERQRQLEAMFPGMADMVPSDDPAAALTRLRLPNAPRLGAKDQALLDQNGGGQSNDWGDKLATIANALGAAQSFASGDAATGGSLLMAGARARQASQLAAAQAQRRQSIVDTLVSQGKLDPNVASAIADDGSAVANVLAPKPVRNDTIDDFNWYKGLSPEDRALYEQMRPVYRQGADGQFYRVSPSTPPAITEDDWNKGQVVGGGGGNATGGFPSNIPSGSPLAPPRFRR